MCLEYFRVTGVHSDCCYSVWVSWPSAVVRRVQFDGRLTSRDVLRTGLLSKWKNVTIILEAFEFWQAVSMNDKGKSRKMDVSSNKSAPT